MISLIVYLGLTLTKDGTTINNENKRILNKKNTLNLLNFITFKRAVGKTSDKIAAQIFEAGKFRNIFLRF